MRAICYLTLLCLTGCSILAQPKMEPHRESVTIKYTIVDSLPVGVGGYADWNVEPCEVFILRSVFPNCIAHESLHCFNKAWHGNRPSAEWCKVDK